MSSKEGQPLSWFANPRVLSRVPNSALQVATGVQDDLRRAPDAWFQTSRVSPTFPPIATFDGGVPLGARSPLPPTPGCSTTVRTGCVCRIRWAHKPGSARGSWISADQESNTPRRLRPSHPGAGGPDRHQVDVACYGLLRRHHHDDHNSPPRWPELPRG